MVEVGVEMMERFGDSGFSSPLPHIWTVLSYCIERMDTIDLKVHLQTL